jgi:hypothetical protein
LTPADLYPPTTTNKLPLGIASSSEDLAGSGLISSKVVFTVRAIQGLGECDFIAITDAEASVRNQLGQSTHLPLTERKRKDHRSNIS